MKFSVTLVDSVPQIEQAILSSLLPQVSQYAKEAMKNIKNEISSIVLTSIMESPEYDSLLNGKLKYELGLSDGASQIAGLLKIWTSNIEYNFDAPQIVKDKIKGGFSINMIKIDFSDVLYTDYAYMTDQLRGYSLPWLQWLLLEGNAVLIKGYYVTLGPSARSRTGFAVMTPAPNDWKIPAEFAGTSNDNWITRAIEACSSAIETSLTKVLQ